MFDIRFENDIKYGNVLITKENDKITFSIDNMFYLQDDIQYINNFCKRLNDLEYNSVLILGLGLGIIPYYLENFKSITSIDVVETNENVILATSDLNHLKSTNIIHHNLYTYQTDKKYDLIIADMWWVLPPYYDSRIQSIERKYKKILNKGGKIYIPILDKIIYL
jgi:tRNA1(Val) A37 N6-methylase TrmN6